MLPSEHGNRSHEVVSSSIVQACVWAQTYLFMIRRRSWVRGRHVETKDRFENTKGHNGTVHTSSLHHPQVKGVEEMGPAAAEARFESGERHAATARRRRGVAHVYLCGRRRKVWATERCGRRRKALSAACLGWGDARAGGGMRAEAGREYCSATGVRRGERRAGGRRQEGRGRVYRVQ